MLGCNNGIRGFHENLEREPQPEAAVSFRTVVTFVTWLISRTEFYRLELVL